MVLYTKYESPYPIYATSPILYRTKGALIDHSRISRLKDHVSMYFESYPKMVNAMKLEWVVLKLSGLILK